MQREAVDAIVVGAGPNGLAAAITLAREGLRVVVHEANDTIGGGARTEALTLPGFLHDTCSAVHPLAAASPFFRELSLERFGLSWVHPEAPLAHPLDDGRTAVLWRSIERTAEGLGRDGARWRRLHEPLVRRFDDLLGDLLAPPHLPAHPLLVARFGATALLPASLLARACFTEEPARALLAGLAAHSLVPLERLATSAIGLVLGAAGHAAGWPFPSGGAQRIADALAACLRAHGGEIVTGSRVDSLDALPPARAVLLDLTPRQVVRIAGSRLPPRYRARLERYRYGPAVFKLDWALSGPIPWKDPDCARAGTVHLGGTLDEVRASERGPLNGRLSERPFVLLAQPSLFDPTRAPPGRHVAWGYCHVPLGFAGDAAALVEDQVERFAPGFRDVVLARHVMRPADLERRNANLVEGDINGGTQDLAQTFTRPVGRIHPHATPVEGLYLCSSSTPPGGGVHGMAGYHAAKLALGTTFGRELARSPRET